MFSKKRGECSECGYEGIYANNSKKLCGFCNKKNKKVKPINKESKKQKIVSQQLRVLKHSISQEAFDRDEYFCEGCGREGVPLDRSHIISVGQRKDLELERDNIQLLCRSCHEKWESRIIDKMMDLKCFDSNLRYIEYQDTEFYQKIVYKMSHN